MNQPITFSFSTSYITNIYVNMYMYTIYVNNTLPLALAVHEISRHFWAAYATTLEKQAMS